MKTYSLKFAVSVIEGDADAYSPKKAVHFEVKENLPANVDAERYLKQRLGEEVKRNFAALVDQIDNKSEEAKAVEDPLEF